MIEPPKTGAISLRIDARTISRSINIREARLYWPVYVMRSKSVQATLADLHPHRLRTNDEQVVFIVKTPRPPTVVGSIVGGKHVCLSAHALCNLIVPMPERRDVLIDNVSLCNHKPCSRNFPSFVTDLPNYRIFFLNVRKEKEKENIYILLQSCFFYILFLNSSNFLQSFLPSNPLLFIENVSKMKNLTK